MSLVQKTHFERIVNSLLCSKMIIILLLISESTKRMMYKMMYEKYRENYKEKLLTCAFQYV